jgi:hypothetical protein
MDLCQKRFFYATFWAIMMKNPISMPVDVAIVAVPETAGSVLLHMLDVLLPAGNI